MCACEDSRGLLAQMTMRLAVFDASGRLAGQEDVRLCAACLLRVQYGLQRAVHLARTGTLRQMTTKKDCPGPAAEVR